MKRPTKSLPDTDLRGRVRRHPRPEPDRAVVQAKFLDGPLAGRTLDVPKDADFFGAGPTGHPFWLYSYAGKEGRTPLYAEHPEQRSLRKMISWHVGKTGRDPRVDRAATRLMPARRTEPSKRGRGARLRAAKREAARATA